MGDAIYKTKSSSGNADSGAAGSDSSSSEPPKDDAKDAEFKDRK